MTNVRVAITKQWLEHLRLAILRFLQQTQDIGANESLLFDALRGIRLNADREQIRSALDWLAERKLVKVEEYDRLKLADITELGIDVADGKRFVDGVRHPSRRA